MRDNLHRCRAIRDAFTQYDPRRPIGTVARHLTTLAALISGMVASQSTQLPNMAIHVPDGTKPESRVKRFYRWVGNDHSTDAGYLVPYAKLLLRHLALRTLVWVLDGRVVGRGGVALMIHGVYKGQALPLAWPVRQGAKGHFPEDLHSALVEQVQQLIPPGASVVVLGDGACDGMRLQHTVQQAGWAYVCRTGRHMTAWWQGEPLRRDTLGWLSRPGTLVALPDALLTEDAYGPVMLSCCSASTLEGEEAMTSESSQADPLALE